MRTFAICLLALLLPAAHVHAQQASWSRLNDTGITWSGEYPSGNDTVCNPDTTTHPGGQDCHYGRDAEAGTLTKMGGSTPNNSLPNGFDYSRVCNSGHLADQGDCPGNPLQGTGSSDWGCTRDNLTGLVWEVKVNNASHLRHMGHTYTWYDSSSPDGNFGTASGGVCVTTGRCDTEKYVEDVNAASLCGHKDWRMPTVKELESIVDFGRANPAIDLDYFPNTPSSVVWSGSPRADSPDNAWSVSFSDGNAYFAPRYRDRGVRLVRAGQ